MSIDLFMYVNLESRKRIKEENKTFRISVSICICICMYLCKRLKEEKIGEKKMFYTPFLPLCCFCYRGVE